MKLLRSAERLASPWKNGGGATREIARHPDDGHADDFLWRVSIAEVEADGPFSHFEQVDRQLTVLEGSIDLNVAGTLVRLDKFAAPFRFEGDAFTSGSLPDGPMTDLNVMTRRGRYHANVIRASGRVTLSAATILIVALRDVWINGLRLERYDALRVDGGATELDLTWGETMAIELSPVDGASKQ